MKKAMRLICVAALIALALSAFALAESDYTYYPESEAYVGIWVADGFTLEIVHMYDDYNLYNCNIDHVTGENEGISWIYDACAYDDIGRALTSMEIGMKFDYVDEGDGRVASDPMYYSDGAATFRLNDDGTLTWTDLKETPGENETVFRRSEEPGVDYAESDLYTLAEMDEAIDAIEAEFSTWEGCRMHSIRYAGDACVSDENLRWMNELGGKDYAECIEFLSTFHSPVEGGGAWEADKEYINWNWWLAREEGGSWELLTWGE